MLMKQIGIFNRWTEKKPDVFEEPKQVPTYELIEKDGEKGITCLDCGMTSWNEEDFRFRYCGNCHEFHELKMLKKTYRALLLKKQKKAQPTRWSKLRWFALLFFLASLSIQIAFLFYLIHR